MDTSAKDITFDERGICNYCTEFIARSGEMLHENPMLKEQKLKALLNQIKVDGKGKAYDCIVGVSGGVDSSWVLVQVKNLGLRPLAVHMDNGWNSELAQNNIANLVHALNVDLYTYVIDWQEYKGLMQAFFEANVLDVELLYDNAFLAIDYRQAAKYGIRYILSGSNQATEGMRMPPGWNWFKYDKKNIVNIAKRFGAPKIKTFPLFSVVDFVIYNRMKKVRWIPFLDYTEYSKEVVLRELEAKYGYKRYPYKHYESLFTRFYQGYILPRKFNVDKRLIHLSTLIASGQMTRDAALTGINGIAYPSQIELEEDISYFLKKMGWTKGQLDDYISRPEISHAAYPSENDRLQFIVDLANRFIPKVLRQR
jgi:N-acetyl sugar amidotransferase